MNSVNNINRNSIINQIHPEIFELTILPTEQCNFRCTYCYEDFEEGKMKSSVRSGIKELISRNIERIRLLKISWFGGEPLLAQDVIEEISRHAIMESRLNEVIFNADMTTNGYRLDIETLKRMVKLHVKFYQVSLDGFGSDHDITRKKANGSGSFSKIWENLCAMANSNIDFNLLLRLHLTNSNISSVRHLIDELNRKILHDSRISIFLKPIGDLGGPNSGTFEAMNHPDKLSIISELTEIISKNGVPFSSKNVSTPSLCYATKPNSYVIRSNGIIQKCTVKLNDPSNTVGSLSENGSMNINQNKLKPWMRGLETGIAEELMCPAMNFPLEKKNYRKTEIIAVSKE